MFRDVIQQTVFTSDAASSCFAHISGHSFNNDVTFLSTLRALLAQRTTDRVCLHFDTARFTLRDVEGSSFSRAFGWVSGYAAQENSVNVLSVVGSAEYTEKAFEILLSGLEREYPGYRRLEKINTYYRKNFTVECFVNPEQKTTMLFVDNMDVRKMHYLQATVLAYLPWYSNKEAGCSEDEISLMKSMMLKTKDQYLACLDKLAEQYDFRTINIKTKLKGFETKVERQQLESSQTEIANIDRELERINERYATYLRQRDDLLIRILGIRQKIAEGSEESEIMDYFLCNKTLVLDCVSDDQMQFVVKDYLEYFDREAAESVIENHNSLIYEYCDQTMDFDDVDMLLHQIFVAEEPVLRIRMCAAYRFSLRGNVRGIGDFNYPPECSGYLPNPHIDRYQCLGNYGRVINECLSNRDYIMAIEQCVASCRSLNWVDSPVMEEFAKKFLGRRGVKCVELPDGSVVTAKGAIEWLKDQRNPESADE